MFTVISPYTGGQPEKSQIFVLSSTRNNIFQTLQELQSSNIKN